MQSSPEAQHNAAPLPEEMYTTLENVTKNNLIFKKVRKGSYVIQDLCIKYTCSVNIHSMFVWYFHTQQIEITLKLQIRSNFNHGFHYKQDYTKNINKDREII